MPYKKYSEPNQLSLIQTKFYFINPKMKKALQNDRLIEKFKLDLMKYELAGEKDKYWHTYDNLLQQYGYTKIDALSQFIVLKDNENSMYQKYYDLTQKKINQVTPQNMLHRKKHWKDAFENSDKIQYTQKLYCVFSPIHYPINLQFQKIKNYYYLPYTFISGDYVIYSNQIAQKKGIYKGFPVLLLRKLNIDTNIIQIKNYTQFSQVYQIFKQRFPNLNPILHKHEIHLIFNQKHIQEQNKEEFLYEKLQYIKKEIQALTKIRLQAVVSRNQLICQLFIKQDGLKLFQDNQWPPLVLIDKNVIRKQLNNCKISSLPGMPLNKIRFLNTYLKIFTIGQLLTNLHILQIMTSIEQTQFYLQSCLGIDHRQTQAYIQKTKKQLQSYGLSYKKLFPQQKVSYLNNINIHDNKFLQKQQKIILQPNYNKKKQVKKNIFYQQQNIKSEIESKKVSQNSNLNNFIKGQNLFKKEPEKIQTNYNVNNKKKKKQNQKFYPLFRKK